MPVSPDYMVYGPTEEDMGISQDADLTEELAEANRVILRQAVTIYDLRARAERAEAERDALREALEPFAKLVERAVDSGNKYTLVQVDWCRKARTALHGGSNG